MRGMLRILAVLAIAWIVLLPPLFTAGECTREFERERARVEADRSRLGSVGQARQYWNARGVPYQVLGASQCQHARNAFITACPSGQLVLAGVPVRNVVCRLYRDDAVTVQLDYDSRDRLARIQSDMAPYKSLPLPALGFTLHWAR